MAWIFDDDLQTLVRAQEKETGEEAPYFVAETQREATIDGESSSENGGCF